MMHPRLFVLPAGPCVVVVISAVVVVVAAAAVVVASVVLTVERAPENKKYHL